MTKSSSVTGTFKAIAAMVVILAGVKLAGDCRSVFIVVIYCDYLPADN